jgi:hypothetical protein
MSKIIYSEEIGKEMLFTGFHLYSNFVNNSELLFELMDMHNADCCLHFMTTNEWGCKSNDQIKKNTDILKEKLWSTNFFNEAFLESNYCDYQHEQ